MIIAPLTRILGYEFDIEYKVVSESKVADRSSGIDHAQSGVMKVKLLAMIVPSYLHLHINILFIVLLVCFQIQTNYLTMTILSSIQQQRVIDERR